MQNRVQLVELSMPAHECHLRQDILQLFDLSPLLFHLLLQGSPRRCCRPRWTPTRRMVVMRRGNRPSHCHRHRVLTLPGAQFKRRIRRCGNRERSTTVFVVVEVICALTRSLIAIRFCIFFNAPCQSNVALSQWVVWGGISRTGVLIRGFLHVRPIGHECTLYVPASCSNNNGDRNDNNGVRLEFRRAPFQRRGGRAIRPGRGMFRL